jgi:hypothetical protein
MNLLLLIGAIIVILALAWENRHYPDVWRD